MTPLSPQHKLDVAALLEDLEHYRPRRSGWSWRRRLERHSLGAFVYRNASADLARSVPLPAAAAFGDIDPQCDLVITTEIASGRFEDDLRRMRMAAWLQARVFISPLWARQWNGWARRQAGRVLVLYRS